MIRCTGINSSRVQKNALKRYLSDPFACLLACLHACLPTRLPASQPPSLSLLLQCLCFSGFLSLTFSCFPCLQVSLCPCFPDSLLHNSPPSCIHASLPPCHVPCLLCLPVSPITHSSHALYECLLSLLFFPSRSTVIQCMQARCTMHDAEFRYVCHGAVGAIRSLQRIRAVPSVCSVA